MQLASPTVFTTPLQIYHAAKQHFSSAEASLKIHDGNLVQLDLTLSPHLPIMSLTCAVDARQFSVFIQQAVIDVQLRQMLQQTEAYPINIELFALMHPLSDWQTFRRNVHESKGNKCVDAISNYLQNMGKTDPLLEYLGLAPGQVEKSITEGDLVYFRAVLSKIECLDAETRGTALIRFKQQYPKMYNHLFGEIVGNLKKVAETGDDFRHIFNTLNQHVIGQEAAVEKMAGTLTSQKNQSGNKVFLFVGPTGVGKTELAKAVAKTKNNRFAMFAMNQYQNEMDSSKLFGSSSGYVGSTDKPHFAKEMDLFNPVKIRTEGSKRIYKISHAVVLFDEFEKAHSKVKQSLLTLFDESHCTVNYTETASNVTLQYKFEQCVIICTSNLYQAEILNSFQQKTPPAEISELFIQLNKKVPSQKSFSPELLGRMTVVPFGPIPKGASYQKLIKLKFDAFCLLLQRELSCQEVAIENERLILNFLENKLYGEGTDIRRLSMYFDEIKTLIYKELGSLLLGGIVFTCDAKDVPQVKLAVLVEKFGVKHELDPLPLP